MNAQEKILGILEDITGTDEVRNDLDLALFDEGLLDSLGTVQLLVELEEECQVTVPVSDFEREDWATPKMIIEKVTALQP